MARRLQRFTAAGLVWLVTLYAAPAPAVATEPPSHVESPRAGGTDLMDQEAEAQASAPVLTLEEALKLAEEHNPGLQLARIQLQQAEAALAAAPDNAETYASAASLYAEAELGLTIPETAITPEAASQQARITYEQAAAQYMNARQQVRLSALQAYAEWQRATAMVAAQESALQRAKTQAEHVKAMLEAGTVAKYDLLQVQAQVAGQEAAVAGAVAAREAARQALETVIGFPLTPGLQPEPMELRSSDVRVETDLDVLTARALANRPDLRDAVLNLHAARLQASLAEGGNGAAGPQLQSAASQYHQAAAQARTEVRQAVLQLEVALEELKAREAALIPAQEALRLAELRYDAGLSTYLEVQSAFAAALQAEASCIQAATNVLLGLYQLARATGDL